MPPILRCSKCGQDKPVHISVLMNGVSQHYCVDCVEPVDFDNLPDGIQRLLHRGKAMMALLYGGIRRLEAELMIQTMLEQYRHYRRISRRARPYAWDVALVAKAMLRLNQHARHRYSGRQTIYALKAALLRCWYERGYLEHVCRVRQVLECRSCGGSGRDGWNDDGSCYHCDGTGVYRDHWLYEMTFRIGDARYTFHQPGSLVDWMPEIVPPKTDRVITGLITSERQVSARFAEICYCVVAQYLPYGYTRPFMTRWDVLRERWRSSDLRHRLWRVRHRTAKFFRRLRERWNAIASPLLQIPVEPDLPF